jgi:hypothetical protein
MTSLRHGLTALIVAMAIGAGTPAVAQQMQNLGTFKNWTAWKGTDANGEMCYISATPQSTAPDGVRRSPIHFLVIHRKGLGTKNEVQTLIGYPFSTANSNASATIDGKTYPMVTEGEAAWLASTTDTYDLGGVTAAMAEIDKACA